MKTPKCFDSPSQYRRWHNAMEQGYDVVTHCTDCTPEYQDSMMRVGRCEHPEVRFKIDKHGMVEGWGAK